MKRYTKSRGVRVALRLIAAIVTEEGVHRAPRNRDALNSWADMTHLVPAETWPQGNEPRGVSPRITCE